jgi:hypothetical protein
MSEEEKINQPTDDCEQSTENKSVNSEMLNVNEQPQTTNTQLQTEEMEVHKHPHHITHKKKWGEYLLEFLMLFLAVFLGFVAENIRETKVEHERENEYAKALYEEFYADSVAFTKKINARLGKERDCDYLKNYIMDSSLTSLSKEFYPAYTTVFYLINSYTFEPKDGVLSQLKSSGSLRYFKNVALQKLFGDISVAINNVRYRNEQEYQFFANPVKGFMLQHYDFNWINDLRNNDNKLSALDLINRYRKSDTLIKANILNLSTFNRSEATNMIMFYKTMVVSSRTLQLNDYIQTNQKILQMLREKYSVSNE